MISEDGVDVIILDHHIESVTLPNAYAQLILTKIRHINL